MIFSLDVRRARKGDCLLLHFGSKAEPGLMMIDGGPSGVYLPHLKPRLEQVRKARRLGRQEPLPVDLLMVSHVDDDHIQGILDLAREELVAKMERRPQMVDILSFWHNSFDEIIDNDTEILTASMTGVFGGAAVSGSGELSDERRAEIEDESAEDDPEVVDAGLKVLASIAQGFKLREDAEGLGYPRNPEFDEELVLAREDAAPVTIAPGLTFTVIGPMARELEALRKKHREWLKDLKRRGKSPSQALAAYVDKSVPNLSSIVVLAESEGKCMLLTGDARGDKIIQGLQLVGRLGPGKKSKISVDLLKVPHHGSANNLDDDFFERIIASHYVFSGDGEHGNPERESLEMLLNARGEEDYTVHLTYPIDEIDAARKLDWEKEQNKEKIRKTRNPDAKVRPNWSPKKHSLAALLKDNSDFAAKLRTVGDEQAHVIDLADPLASAWPSLVS
jgi:hypothetical protein